MTAKRLYFLYHFKAVRVETFKDLPFMLNRKEFHSFDDIKEMIEKMIKTNLPENLFSNDQNVRKRIAKFDVKKSPNSRKIEPPRSLKYFETKIQMIFSETANHEQNHSEILNNLSSHSLQDLGISFVCIA